MGFLILPTKLNMPIMGEVVDRPALSERLEIYSQSKLTVLSAPAGSGKTTLVSHWLQKTRKDFLWFSIDKENDDPASFWLYLCTGFQKFDPQLGRTAINHLEQGVRLESHDVVDLLIQDLLRFARKWDRPSQIVVVLDDFHVISHPELLRSFNRFLDYMPAWLHVVITARRLPKLSLAHRHSRLQLNMLTQHELAMTRADVTRLLQLKLALSPDGTLLDTIMSQTEGWISAVLLTGLSMKAGGSQTQTSLRQNEYLSEFLLEEVFSQFDDAFQNDLLSLATVPRFCAAMCEVMTTQGDGNHFLNRLHDANLFIVRLDDEGCWYRMHSLLQEWLLQHMRAVSDFDEASCRKKAMQWFMAQTLYEDAIAQAFVLQDWRMAYQIFCRLCDSQTAFKQVERFSTLVTAFPPRLQDALPRLAAIQAGLRYVHGEYHQAAQCVHRVYRISDQMTPRGNPLEAAGHAEIAGSVDAETAGYVDTDDLLISVQMARLLESNLLRFQGQLESASALCRAVYELSIDSAQPLKCWAYYGLAMDSFILGRIEECIAMSFKAINLAKAYKDGSCVIATSNWVTEALKIHGRISLAQELLDTNYDWLEQQGMLSLPNVCLLHGSFVSIYLETNQLSKAWNSYQNLEDSIQKYTDSRDVVWARYYLHYDLLMQSGRLAQVAQVLDQLEVYLGTHFDQLNQTIFPDLALLRALQALQEGRYQSLLAWANASDQTVAHKCEIQNVFERGFSILAKGFEGREISSLASQMREQAQAQGLISSEIESYLIEAIIATIQGRISEAQQAMVEALQLASPCGYINLFVCKGPVVKSLLQSISGSETHAEYCQKLLDAFEVREQFKLQSHACDEVESFMPETPSVFIEPLTSREQDVLMLIRQGCSNKKAAELLALSPTTIRTHLQNIYGKLGVNSRTEAIAKIQLFEQQQVSSKGAL